MSPPQPDAPQSSHRTWLMIAGVLSVVVLAILLMQSDPNRDTATATSLSPKTPRSETFSQQAINGTIPSDMQVRVWRVPADFPDYLTDETGPADENYFDEWTGARRSYRSSETAQALCDHGVDFPPGSYARLSLNSGKPEACNTPENLALINQIIAEIGPMKMFVLDADLFHPLAAPTSAPPRNRRNIQATTQKLQDIILSEVDFDGTTVQEAVDWLNQQVDLWNDESVEFDPSTSRLTMTHTKRSLDETAELFTQLAIKMSKARAGF